VQSAQITGSQVVFILNFTSNIMRYFTQDQSATNKM